ncbi:phage portal protein [Micromonospora sp. WMMD1102]|uniref:phage portal protein n=1 Tax=Micromonospora sp. WMMD1102 TaxID=3016105 RepID=UPI0024157F9C|nr:phage portal protein [Micromonospora sp. WMMD1102]MDG4784345.1 phage portal protein [Micromonospora sp. WMMD1102]MDG4784418.1 phage portal protein [Micromonospora sp. WMMD1102]
MSLFRREKRHATIAPADQLIPGRSGGKRGAVQVTNDTALRHSAVWACLRLRADLMSTFPVDTYRKVAGQQVEVPKPPVLVAPGGERWDYVDWMYASQFDLDRAGNTLGLIVERNALGLPARIELQPIEVCSVTQKRDTGALVYRLDGREYGPEQVWHERQFVVAGLPVGLSPIAYAAWTIGEYLSIQQFALDWFGGGGVPKARMKNVAKTIDRNQAQQVKDVYQASVANGDLFVHGSDWEFSFLQAQNVGMEWIDGKRYGLADISRFLGAPVDLIEAAISAPGSITYQSALQRNLQFLVMHLGPAVARREKNLNKLLPAPRFVKLNTNALLRMDPQTQAKVITERINNRTLAPSEARAFYDKPPLTPEQEAEFDRLFGAPRSAMSEAATRATAGWPWEQVNPLSAAPYPYPDPSEVGQ